MTKIPHTLDSQRLQLRQIEPKDALLLNEEIKRSHEHLSQWVAWAKPDSPLEEQEVFCKQSHEEYLEGRSATYGLWIKKNDQLAGLLNVSYDDESVPSAGIGYWGAKETLGCGYISEACRVICHNLMEDRGYVRVWLTCDGNNLASQRVAERSGMTQEARLRHSRRNKQGELSDTLIYSIVKNDSL